MQIRPYRFFDGRCDETLELFLRTEADKFALNAMVVTEA